VDQGEPPSASWAGFDNSIFFSTSSTCSPAFFGGYLAAASGVAKAPRGRKVWSEATCANSVDEMRHTYNKHHTAAQAPRRASSDELSQTLTICTRLPDWADADAVDIDALHQAATCAVARELMRSSTRD